MRADLLASGASESVVDDAVLILSELLSNACRHARPLHEDQSVQASWRTDVRGELAISVTDGGGPTRPLPATPSITAHGGRGLAIIGALASDWGVREELYEVADGMSASNRATPTGARGAKSTRGVTVWVVLPGHKGFGDDFAESLGLDLAGAEELR